MRPGTSIALIAAVSAVLGSYLDEPAVFFIAGAWGWLAFNLHRIEVKLNRLLDAQGIVVRDDED